MFCKTRLICQYVYMVTINPDNQFAADRQYMLSHHLIARDITNPKVLDIMGQLPREKFIPQKYAWQAYADCPLPIGIGQTISQPYIVALMTQHLRLTPDCTVLELGTGSGYQTAVLAKLARKVCTIERHSQLSEIAQNTLANLNITNVEYFIGDGSTGWPDPAEFDRIIITAAVPHIPKPLTNQLKNNGLILAPVGTQFSQDLITHTKTETGLTKKQICPVRFVKLIGKNAFPE